MNVAMYTIEEWNAKRQTEITNSPRQEEIERCNKFWEQCFKCKYNKLNTGESFTCGATGCVLGYDYQCTACSFGKYVGGDNKKFEKQISAPPYPCEGFEEYIERE